MYWQSGKYNCFYSKVLPQKYAEHAVLYDLIFFREIVTLPTLYKYSLSPYYSNIGKYFTISF